MAESRRTRRLMMHKLASDLEIMTVTASALAVAAEIGGEGGREKRKLKSVIPLAEGTVAVAVAAATTATEAEIGGGVKEVIIGNEKK